MHHALRSFRSFCPAITTKLIHYHPAPVCGVVVALCSLAALASGSAGMVFAQSKTFTVTTLAVSSGSGPVTSVSSGSVVTLTASVNAGTTLVTPGQVDFCDASAAYCTDVHLLGTAQLTSAGTAVFKFRPGAGSHSYQAVFRGTNTYSASSSSASSLTVTATPAPVATTTGIAKTGSWGNYALTGTVIEVGSTSPLTGSVSFLDTNNANTVLGTADLGTGMPGLTWLNPQTPLVDRGPNSVAVGDFNGDGIPDLAVVNGLKATISILSGNGDGTFTAVFETPVLAGTPDGIAVADFNSDGCPDLAVGNTLNNKLTVFLGHCDGTFTSASTSPSAGSAPLSVATGDFNGDGIPDLAAANYLGNTLTILLGNGDGTFKAAPVSPTVGENTEAIGVGDFNGDGKADLAVASNGTVAVLLGNGDGTFAAGGTATIASWAVSIAVGDFNGDGKPDLAVGNGDNVSGSSTTVAIFLGNGDGTLTAAKSNPEVSGGAIGMVLGDFNQDGIPDLAVPDDNYVGAVTVLLGKGDGTFSLAQAAPSTGSWPVAIAVGDFNGDGRMDMAVANNFGSSVTVLLTEPTETATTSTTPISPASPGQHMVEASYEGNTNYSTSVSSPTLLWGQPPSTTTTLAITSGGSPVTAVAPGSAVTLTATVMAGTIPLTTGQVNFCDASATVCTDMHLIGSASLTSGGTASFKFIPGPGQHSYKAEVLENAYGIASFSPVLTLTVSVPSPVPATTTTTISASGNIGNYTLTATVAGIGATAPLTGSVSFLDTSFSNKVLANAPLGTSTPGLGWLNSSSTPFTNAAFMMFAVGDFNGDGILDVAAVSSYTKTVTILLGNGDGTFKQSTSLALAAYTTAVVAGDFNGDGKLDLAVSMVGYGSGLGSMTILLGKGDGTFSPAPNAPTVGYSDYVFAAADFNGDGKLDLLVNESSSGRILLGNGDGTFTQGPVVGIPITLAVADLNGDGIPDLVAGGNTNAAWVYLGNGDGSFTPVGMGLPEGSLIGSAVVADFNGDGIPDIAVVGKNYSPVTVFLGKGDGTFTPVAGSPNSPVSEPGGIAAADLNHDGKLDMVITNWNSSIGYSQNPDLTVLLGNGDGTFTQTPGDTQLNGAWSIVAGDFNGDGTPDLVVGAGSGISVMLTQPTQTATATASGVAPLGPAPHLVDANYPGNSHYNSSTSGTTSLDVQVATPVIAPASGIYTSTQTVTITDATPGATIYYVTGQAWPENWTVYTGPVTINTEGAFEFQAYATETGYEQSSIATAIYTLQLPPAPKPVISPGAGSYAGQQKVSITDSAAGASIYYTLDGTLPTINSTKYIAPITVAASETVAAIAAGGGYNTSAAAVAQIYIDSAASSFIYTVAGNGSRGYGGDSGAATAAALNAPLMTLLDSTGNLYIADSGNSVVRKVDAKTHVITTVAGTGLPGYSGDNGPATKAQLGGPSGIALDRSGNLYISDGSNEVVRKVSAASGVITTVAGSATATSLGDNGPATSAQLTDPSGLVLDNSGNLYIGSWLRIRKLNTSTGIITTYAGNGVFGIAGDNGPATSASLGIAFSLAIDATGNIYLADPAMGLVRKVTAKTGIITRVAGLAYANNPTSIGDGGPAIGAVLKNPYGVAVDVSGNVYIADTDNSEIREVTASNGIINRVIGSPSTACASLSGDGAAASSSGICQPEGVTIDSAGNLYIAESGSARVRKVTASALPPTSAASAPVFNAQAGAYAIPQIVTITSSTPGAAIYLTLDGQVPTTASNGYQGPINVNGPVTIKALAVAPGYLSSEPVTAAYTIALPPTSMINTVAGNGVPGKVTPGAAATSQSFEWIDGIAVDSGGNLYIPDEYNEVIWEVSATTGNARIVVGTLGAEGDTGDLGPATLANLSGPTHVAFDQAGDMYIAESSGRIRMVTAGSGIINTYAGGGNWGVLGDNGPATSAFLDSPQGLAVDSAGNLYIADLYDYRVRKVSPTGIITTVAGGSTNGVLGDGGPAASAYLSYPYDVAVDGAGNLYIADADAGRVRMVSAKTGIISTFAGDGNAGGSGDGVLATQAEVLPMAVTVDGAGNVYIANWPDSVRVVNPATHIITTVAGSGFTGFSGDGGSATLAELYGPYGLAADSAGNLYISDSFNSRVRKISYPSPAPTPVLSLAAGTYPSAQTLTITDAIQGATIYYTTDGSTPTPASTVYSGSIAVSLSETVKAIAVASGYTASAVASATFTIPQPKTTPTITWAKPAAITYGTALSATQLNATSKTAGTFAYSPAAGTVLDAGSQTLSTTFTPTDTNTYSTATAGVTLTVNNASQTITFTAPATPVTYGAAPITLSATASSKLPITFTVTSGPATLRNNTLTFTGVGSVVVAANQVGNNDYSAATAVSKTITVNKFTPTVGFKSSASSFTYGASAILTATLNNAGSNFAEPTGSVTFLSGATSLGAGTLDSNGVATLTLTTLPVGNDGITASYGGDGNYATAKSSAVSIIIGKAAQTISFTAPASPVTYGISPIVLVATASSNLAVTFTVTPGGPATVSGSMLTITGAGQVVVTANQSGNSNYAAAPAVQKAITVNPGTATSKLTSSSASITYGASVTLTATLTGSGSTKPSGTVTFYNGTASIGTGTLNSSAVATLAVTTLPVGSDSITASYLGDTHYGAVVSSPLTETVKQATPTVKLTSSASTAAYGASITFTATLTGTGAKPTGAVTFLNGTASLGTGTLNSSGVTTLALTTLPVGANSIKASYAGDTNYATATSTATAVTVTKATQTITLTTPTTPVTYGVAPVTLAATASSGLTVTFTATGPATFNGNTLTITGAGSVTVTANQAGNANYNAAIAVSKSIVVNKATPAVSLQASATSITTGSSVTLTATLTGPGSTAPTGTVSFLDGTATLGTGTLSSGVTTYSTTKLATGKHSVTAKYAGDSNYLTVTSAAVTVTVAAK